LTISFRYKSLDMNNTPPFVIEKCIKSCAGEVKYATKLKSGGLMIECQRKQQSLNLLSLKQIHNINISSTGSEAVMYNSPPSLSPPTTECQHGRYLNSEDLRRKVSGIPRMVYSNSRISIMNASFVPGPVPQ
jgi:hypothetical protein